MKSTTIILASFLASVAIAQPYRHLHPKKQAKNEKRNDDEVVWVTDYEYVTETIPVTTTIWVTEGYEAPSTAPASTTTISLMTSSASMAGQEFFEPETTPLPAPTTSTTTTPIYVAPTPTPAKVEPVTVEAPKVEPTIAPAPVPTTTIPVYVAPPATTTPVYVAPVPTTQAAAPLVVPVSTPVAAVAAPVATAPASGSSSSGSGKVYSGDITYYDTFGYGSCGYQNDGTVERVVALPVGLMGAQSNGNPFCGRHVKITCTKTGKSTTAMVVDKCMGCTGDSIDLSDSAFNDIADPALGRTLATWFFTD